MPCGFPTRRRPGRAVNPAGGLRVSLARARSIGNHGLRRFVFRCSGACVTITAVPKNSGISADARARSLMDACRCARAAEDSRGKDTLVLDLTDVTPIVDYFVITTGASGRQMNA